MVRRLNRVMKNSPDGTGKFLASARPVLTALVVVLVFSFILIPQKSEGGIYAPNPPPALIPETPGPPPPWRTYAWIPGPLAMAPQPIRLGSWRLPAPSFGSQSLDSRPLASGSPWLVLDRR